jgi:PAT family beta-lactamase induction signal transducer AmpG
MTDAAAEPKRSTWAAIAVFLERRTLVMLALGFAAGLPNLLVFDTLSAWLRESGVALQTIGFFSLATLSYSLKFLWAPLVDRNSVPVLTAMLGHRRSWMLVCQGLIIFGLWLISGANPAVNLALVAAFAVFVAFASATQDIVIDAWRIEAAGEDFFVYCLGPTRRHGNKSGRKRVGKFKSGVLHPSTTTGSP